MASGLKKVPNPKLLKRYFVHTTWKVVRKWIVKKYNLCFFNNLNPVESESSGKRKQGAAHLEEKVAKKGEMQSKNSPATALTSIFFKNNCDFFLQKEKSTIFAAKNCPNYARA
mgnify:CR=1 FL=1